MVKDLPTKGAEDTGSGRKISEPSSAVVCAKSRDIHIYSQMEYEHDFLENVIRFYCTTLYFFPCNHVMP